MDRLVLGLQRFSAASALAALVAAPAGAQSHVIGGFNMTDFTPQCAEQNFGPLEWGVFRFRPAGVGSNSPDYHYVSFFLGVYTWYLALPSTAQVGEWTAASMVGIGSRLAVTTADVRLIAPVPRVTWDGEIMQRLNIRNLAGIEGCDVTVNAFGRAAN